MAKTQVNIVVTATSLAALGAAWGGITKADAHAAAAKAALKAEAEAEDARLAAGAPAEGVQVPQVITVPVVGASGPTLSDRLGAAPELRLAPLAPIRVGTVAPASTGGTALIPAPPATAPVASAPAGAVAPSAAPAAPAAAALAAPAAAAPAPAPVVAAPAPAPAPAAKPKATRPRDSGSPSTEAAESPASIAPGLPGNGNPVADRGVGSAPAALRAAEDLVRDIEQRCSRFRPDSALSRLNRERRIDDPVLAEITSLALEFRAVTGGAFDPAVGDAVVAAGYDRSMELVRGDGRGPTRTALAHPAIPVHGDSIELRGPGLLDLGGIAKGWTVDRVGRLLEESGAIRYFVDGGGDVLVGGAREQDELIELCTGGYRVGIRAGALASSSTLHRHWSTWTERRTTSSIREATARARASGCRPRCWPSIL
ncbi:MAG: FAD:protein FMN transferase [Dehalococcoidia bacterium]